MFIDFYILYNVQNSNRTNVPGLSHGKIYVFCIDAHTYGNPVRVVTGGSIPRLEGATMFDRRQDFLANHDWIRTGLMFEPCGHDMMSGALLYPPTRADCDIALLFIETSGCLPMCGHGTIGTVTAIIEQGLVTPRTPGLLKLDTPAGLVEAHYNETNDHVEHVRIVMSPLSFWIPIRSRSRAWES